jgi:hypothetical protein
MSSMMGHNLPPQKTSEEERKAFIKQQIDLWVGNLRLDEALKAEELGQYSGIQKALLLRNGLLVGAVRHCRLNPRADSRMPILALITFLADNNEGICRLSVSRMCKILDRSRESIVTSIQFLEEDGQIGVSRKEGLPNCYWPLIPAALAELSANPVWFVDALAPKPRFRIFSSPEEAIAAATTPPNQSSAPDQSSRLDQSSGPDHHQSGGLDRYRSGGVDQVPAEITTADRELVKSSRRTSLVQSSSISLSISPSNNTAARKRAAPRTRLPSNWRPAQLDEDWAAANFVVTKAQIAHQAEKFRNYHHGRGTEMADWSAAWRTWWLNDYHGFPRRPASNGASHSGGEPLPAATCRGLLEMYPVKRLSDWRRDVFGPPPGEKGCQFPSEIIVEFRLGDLK